MIKRDLMYIKLEEPRDYQALLMATHIYCENRDSEEPDEFIERNMLAVVADILDKHGVKYEDDLTGVV